MSLRGQFDFFMHKLCYTIVDGIRAMVFYAVLPFTPLLKPLVEHLLKEIDIKTSGERPDDLNVKNSSLFLACIITSGGFGLTEAYYERYIDPEDLCALMCKLSAFEKTHNTVFKFMIKHPYLVALDWIESTFNINTADNSWNIVGRHYDTHGDAVYEESLDWSRQYSTGFFENTDDLAEAAFNMRELIARKLELKPGMTVLDIGCGYGALAEHLAERYDVKVVGYSVSKKMAAYAQERCTKKGLDVKTYGQDFRTITGKYDRVVAIEVISHLGRQNHRTFFEVAHRSLKEDGIFVMQTISNNHDYILGFNPVFPAYCDFWADLSTPTQLTKASNGLFIIEDWQNFSYHFYYTCNEMRKNIYAKKDTYLKKLDPNVIRKYEIYSSLATASAKMRKTQIFQIVFTKNGKPGGYDRIH